MRRLPPALLATLVAVLPSSMLAGGASAGEVPVDRVMAIYFHRTQRCPTCQKMGSYAEEAVKTGFARQLEEGTLSLHYVNFEDSRNAALTKGYGITGPALIVARVANNKVVRHANLTDIWAKATDKPAFIKYVQDGIASHQAPRDRVVVMYFHRTKRCPTCQKMGSYTDEAVTANHAQQLKEGTVAFYYVNFEDPRNGALVKRYGVSGPALVVAKVVNAKVVDSRNLKEIWAKAPDKGAFIAYVQENVAAYCQGGLPGGRAQVGLRTADRLAD
jgi:thiol-disulfide isomerase/thioredoxin